MAYNGILQIVIRKSDNQVLRIGHCDFANDGTFNSETEEIIEKDFIFYPDLVTKIWEYDDEEETFNIIGDVEIEIERDPIEGGGIYT